jgi:glycosyltransferase involved in cell wall biosynthesis
VGADKGFSPHEFPLNALKLRLLKQSKTVWDVSFVVIAFNEATGIQKCIESILMQKTELTYDIILVDDGSTDSTVEIVKREFGERIQILSQPNLGRGQSRINGVKLAKTSLIAFVDSDIILPANWLDACYVNLENFAGVGGIPVPDGDCSTIHRLLSLQARVKAGSISMTGSNALVRKAVLLEAGNEWQTRLGEDFRLNQILRKKGYRFSSIPNLLVQHYENKSYDASLRWLMNSGIDATKLFFEFKRIRTPDIAFALWLSAVLYFVGSLIHPNIPFGFLVLMTGTAIISTIHFCSKFIAFRTPLRSILGMILNFPLIASYLVGRLFGLFAVVYIKKINTKKLP